MSRSRRAAMSCWRRGKAYRLPISPSATNTSLWSAAMMFFSRIAPSTRRNVGYVGPQFGEEKRANLRCFALLHSTIQSDGRPMKVLQGLAGRTW